MQKLIRLVIRLFYIPITTLIFKMQLFVNGNIVPNNLKIDGLCFFKQIGGKLSISNGFILNSRRASNLVGINNRASFQIIGGRIQIGKNCGFTSTVISSREFITIGDHVKIGGNVRIFDHDYHSLNYLNRRNSNLDGADVRTSPIIIEDDVFIGTNSIILKGVNVGARSIIGAGSVVSIKNIPPDSLVVGNPAKIIKSLI